MTLACLSMSRILLTTLGSLGDLHPLIAMALELRRRGHAVSFCASESYRRKLESLGFGFNPLRPDSTPENPATAQMVREIMDPLKGVERLLVGWVLPHLSQTYADLDRAVKGPPVVDLLVYGELVYPAPLIAEQLGLRSATHITTPMSFFSAHDPPVLPPFPNLSRLVRSLGPAANRLLIRFIKLTTRGWGKPVRRFRAELGLPDAKDPIYEGKFSPQLVLASFSKVLADPQPDWPPNSIITGFSFYDGDATQAPPSGPLTKFLETGEPPIVFTLGSSAVWDPGNFYEESAKAAVLLNKRAVLLMGNNPIPDGLPDSVMALEYIRFSELFPRAAAIVHQGGIGTTGQALRAGCPMLVMPFNFDQPDNAARIARLGVGKTISRKQYSAKLAARRVRELLDNPAYAQKAREISRCVQKETGAAIACDALEGLLR